MQEDNLQVVTDDTHPWKVTATTQRLELTHEHLWLGIIGIPLSLIGLVISVGIWNIPGILISEAWPILSGGSVIGFGFTVMGLHLTFNREVFSLDQVGGKLTHLSGFGPFTRRRSYPITNIERVICRQAHETGSSTSYIMVLEGIKLSKRVVSFPEVDPVLWEGLRWSTFLNISMIDLTDQLDHRL